MHKQKNKSLLTCLSERTDYAADGSKTADGELISAFECDPITAASQFALAKREYFINTGRVQEHDVIAYQIRQSFKPGEITPEEANKVGYDFAERFLKGKHAFIVCTHINRHHIHNHIIWNSTTLDCQRKFRNFWNSTNAVRKLSDTICTEHQLSVVENPKHHGITYNKWLGDKANPSQREVLRSMIDAALAKHPNGFDEFVKLMNDSGYSVGYGKHITFRNADMKKSIRLCSLGDGYSEDEIKAVIAGTKQHVTRDKSTPVPAKKVSLLIDIEAKLREGKSGGYERWAKVFNLKQMAQTVNYLREHNLLDYDELVKRTSGVTEKYHDYSDEIKAIEKRMAEITSLKSQIINYIKTRDVYAGYKKSGYSNQYLSEHENGILLHKTAKKAFDESGIKKLPTIKSLQAEYGELLARKKAIYSDYRTARSEMRELLIHKSNLEKILANCKLNPEKSTGHERTM